MEKVLVQKLSWVPTLIPATILSLGEGVQKASLPFYLFAENILTLSPLEL